MLVLALALPLATAGALPLWAQLAGVEGPHVCHCSVEKHDCVCPKCNTDHDEMRFSAESVKGRCGDDDVGFGGKAIAAVLTPPTMMPSLAEHVLVASRSIDPVSTASPSPPTPPPRSSRAI
jgi:hypothetical protein